MPSSLSSSSLSSASSCGEFEFHPFGRHGIVVTQPDSGRDYPLIDPSEEIEFLLADFYLAYENPADYDTSAPSLQGPLRLAWVYGLGCLSSIPPDFAPTPTHDVDLLVLDTNDEIVFDTTMVGTIFSDRAWGERLWLYEWRNSRGVCRIIVHTKWPSQGEPLPRNYATNIAPERADLDARTLLQMPKRVKSLIIDSVELTATDVEFEAGYNTRFTDLGAIQTIGGRLRQQLQIDATPGTGLGLYPGCTEENPPVRTLNRVQPDANGNIMLAATGCYFVRQPSTVTGSPLAGAFTPGELIVGNDCGPECSCDEYVETAQLFYQHRATYKSLGQQLETSRDLYHDNIARWEAQKECRESRPLRLVALSAMCPFLEVAGQFCNGNNDCVNDIELAFLFEILQPGGGLIPSSASLESGSAADVVCHSTLIRRSAPRSLDAYVLGGEWPRYTAYWTAVEPLESVYVKFRLSFDPPDAYAVRISLSGTISGVPMANIAQKSITIACPDPC